MEHMDCMKCKGIGLLTVKQDSLPEHGSIYCGLKFIKQWDNRGVN